MEQQLHFLAAAGVLKRMARRIIYSLVKFKNDTLIIIIPYHLFLVMYYSPMELYSSEYLRVEFHCGSGYYINDKILSQNIVKYETY